MYHTISARVKIVKINKIVFNSKNDYQKNGLTKL